MCQKTVVGDLVPLAPLVDVPLIDQPFKREAVPLVGSIAPATDKAHRCIMTFVNYAARYPEIVPLKNIDSETITKSFEHVQSS